MLNLMHCKKEGQAQDAITQISDKKDLIKQY